MKKGYIKCPFCANEIKEGAVKCQYCEEFLDGRNSKKKNKLSLRKIILILGILLLLLILFLICWEIRNNKIAPTLTEKDLECVEYGNAGIKGRLHEIYGFQTELDRNDDIIADEDHTIKNIEYYYSEKIGGCFYSYVLINNHNKQTFLEIEEMSYGEPLFDKIAESYKDYKEWRKAISALRYN